MLTIQTLHLKLDKPSGKLGPNTLSLPSIIQEEIMKL